jgi:hypothetical protein
MTDQTEQIKQTEQTKQTNALSESSTNIVNNLSLVTKTKNHSKKAIIILSNYIKNNNIELSENVLNKINFLCELWNSEDKFEFDNLIEIIELHTNNFSEDDLINLEDKYVLKLWKVYKTFVYKLIESGKNIISIYKNNKDKNEFCK